MKAAVANLQRYIFIFILYSSAVYSTIFDQTGITNRTPVYVILDCLIYFLAILSLSTIPRSFFAIIALILGGIFINFTYTPVPLSVSLNGIREILVMLAVPIFYYKVFAEGNEAETMRYVRILKTFGWFFLLVQIVPVLIQYKQFGASDSVGGTYGWLSTGNLTMIIICIVFFLYQFPGASWKKLLLFVLMYPLMLNETKISFILIPMMVVFLFFEPKIKNILMAGAGAVLFLVVFNQLYENDTLNLNNNIMDIFNKDFLDEYLLADYETHPDVPRFTKLILGYNIISQDTRTLLFGMEFGMFRGTTSGEVSVFSSSYNWLLSGTRPYLFIIMLQGGLTLVAGFMLIVLHICNYFRNMTKYILFYFIIFILVMTYAESFRWHNFLIVFMFLMFFVNSDIFKSKSYMNEDIDSYN